MAESLENGAPMGSSASSSSVAANLVEPPSPSSSGSNGDENKQSLEQQQGEKSDTELVKMECPVCLQTCIHPAKLPCGHIFCFLCVKGVAFKNRRCAMCRRDIPPSYLEHPQLVNGLREVEKAAKPRTEDGSGTPEFQWYYEGRNGWWQYDERTSQELEQEFQKKERFCKILVAGFLYIVDFEHKCQIRQNDPSRIRRVKRDLTSIPKKGVAGLRLETNDLTLGAGPSSNSDGALSSADLQAETNLLQMQRNIVVEETEEEEVEEQIRRVNLDGSFESDATNSANNSFGEEEEEEAASVSGEAVALDEAINNLNSLSLSEPRAGGSREPVTIRRRVVTDLFALSDSDDDNEDTNHVIL
ncbi:ring finger protein [Culex quinquefasciatus]|uniref:E3 ubiquitin-protein ligase n=1 Tax=Culex quinquefasciatus TaxID=7176 RepID=B0WVR8_CULQU|nr:E3 ubiquitin-protein ligase rnf146 [Culex quinquefasciatus]XP_039439851.1 E3 ubiquitin-protein ligase rnf146 [Culex pipiens pallens]EDS35675.1 ring finger protein [Culex quinquefasciatus]|eukprot:XP_001861490.1 ring finger protein [Culex quinquefasciatus]